MHIAQPCVAEWQVKEPWNTLNILKAEICDFHEVLP